MQCYKRKQIKDHFPHLTLKTELCIKVYSSEQFIILKEDLNFSLIFSSHLFFFFFKLIKASIFTFPTNPSRWGSSLRRFRQDDYGRRSAPFWPQGIMGRRRGNEGGVKGLHRCCCWQLSFLGNHCHTHWYPVVTPTRALTLSQARGEHSYLYDAWRGFPSHTIRSLLGNFQFLSYQGCLAGRFSATSKHISGWSSTRLPFSPFLSQDVFIKVLSSLPLHIFEDVRILSVKMEFKWLLTCM